MASVFHAYRIVLVALFALGAWQAMLGTWRVERAALAPVLASALYALVLFAVGAAWGLGRPGVFAVHWFGVEAHYDLREWDDWSA